MKRKRGDHADRGTKNVLFATALLVGCASIWRSQVSNVVREPYMDEVFHVRQAQVYCSGDFMTWDPKITTPPGLYLISYFFYVVSGSCSIEFLRAANTTFLIFTSFILHAYLQSSSLLGSRQPAHVILNVLLFPPLFFFSALYYTDVQSCCFVLLALMMHQWHSKNNYRLGTSAYNVVLCGLVALLFRQTNIFWVAIFPAGLTIVDVARQAGGETVSEREHATFFQACQISWEKGILYDPPVRKAWIEDYAQTVISILIISALNFKRLLTAVLPYIFLLIAFAAFVVWNGGVVLGDKSNHVASLHLPQMLYLWPYMLFFSFPITVPLTLHLFATFSQQGMEGLRDQLPRSWILAITSLVAALIVHFNTIVHPFTLADNRHYIFYVFRALMRKPAFKYMATPVYVICGYVIIQALGGKGEPPKLKSPHPTSKRSKLERQTHDAEDENLAPEPVRTSFVIVWFATTALSLITAPLVEPRYCIIPWIIWRLHVPNHSAATLEEQIHTLSWSEWLGNITRNGRSRLFAETAWFCVVNAIAGYLFLYRGFAWKQEPENIQRFMW